MQVRQLVSIIYSELDSARRCRRRGGDRGRRIRIRIRCVIVDSNFERVSPRRGATNVLDVVARVRVNPLPVGLGDTVQREIAGSAAVVLGKQGVPQGGGDLAAAQQPLPHRG